MSEKPMPDPLSPDERQAMHLARAEHWSALSRRGDPERRYNATEEDFNAGWIARSALSRVPPEQQEAGRTLADGLLALIVSYCKELGHVPRGLQTNLVVNATEGLPVPKERRGDWDGLPESDKERWREGARAALCAARKAAG